MNKAKLSALCAKARGLRLTPSGYYLYLFPEKELMPFPAYKYNPIDDANQADDLLEYVADKQFATYSSGRNPDKTHWAQLEGTVSAHSDDAPTERIAKILCALRASPEVTDAEINDAMEGE